MTAVSLWIWMLVQVALGQPAGDIDPGVVPSPGIAIESGPGALWVNPSNLAYDPDLRYGAWLRYGHDDPTRWSGAATIGASGVSGGVRFLRRAAGLTDLSLDLGAGIPLPRRFAIGAAMRWQLLAQRTNVVSFDAALSWRPLSWFGVTLLTRSVGNPGGNDVALPQTAAGVSFRPFGRALLIGFDYLHTFQGDRSRAVSWTGEDATDRFRVSLRARPTRGLFVRAHLDSQLAFGLGLEMFFDGVGYGVYADRGSLDGVPDAVVFVGTDERDEDLAPPRRQVPDLVLDGVPPYQPERPLVGRPDRSWWSVLQQFEQAASERTIRGVLLTLGGADLGAARWAELRSAIRRLRVDGKEVVVLLMGSPGDGAILTASAASRVLAHPSATLDLTGPSLTEVHLGGLLDAVGVDVQVARTGDYKSAADIWTLDEPSSAEREQQLAILDQARSALIDGIADGRQRTREDVAAWVDGGPWTAAEAEAMGLVDGRAYPDQVRDELEQMFGGKVTRIDLDKVPRARSPWDAPDQIAVVYVDGPIVSETGQVAGLIGVRQADAGTIEKQLLRASRTPEVRAVVLRIDSPGGSTLASDQLWRTVQRVRATGRPVVVSMGNVAASGGYYIATAADSIWAEPGTLTGSIGVIAMRPNAATLLDRLGVTVTTWSRGRHAPFDSLLHPLDPLQQARLQALVDDGYRRFLDRVARGRGMTPAQAEALGEGRVWTGRDALENGLVDHIGGLAEAVADARHLAGIPDRRPVDVVPVDDRRRTLGRVLGQVLRIGPARDTGTTLSASMQGPVGLLWWAAQSGDEAVWMIDPGLLGGGTP